MSFVIRASCFVVALAIANPALAQDGSVAKIKVSQRSPKDAVGQGGYYKYCGAQFVCYTGIPMTCSPHTRPYQNIAEHQCFCLPDNCP
ncbi:MAG TPA: hypothetical protein VGI22_26525 [Xanthobacteraceae bacterium]|jgi:hypothetical protein